MIKDVILIFASYKEMNSLLYQSSLVFKKLKPDYYISTYKNLTVKVYISGIGYEYCQQFLNYLKPSQNSLIIKLGTVAIIDPAIDLLSSFIPQIICFEDKSIDITKIEKFSIISDIVKDKIVNKKLLTTKFSLINREKAEELLNIGYSFVDMETFYIIDSFKKYPLFPLLIGTDRGDSNAKRDFLNNISIASQKLRESMELILRLIDLNLN